MSSVASARDASPFDLLVAYAERRGLRLGAEREFAGAWQWYVAVYEAEGDLTPMASAYGDGVQSAAGAVLARLDERLILCSPN